MKLGIIGGYDRKSFEMIKNRGLSFSEVTLHSYEQIESFLSKKEEIKLLISEFGADIGSVGVWGMDHISKDDGSPIAQMLNAELSLIDCCGELNCQSYVTGVNFVKERSYLQNCNDAVKYLELLLERGRQKGVKICVYNCDWNNFIHDDMGWTMTLGHLPELYIKFDASHTVWRRGDYLEEILKWGNRFGHAHIKGCLISGGKYHDNPPAGLDSINWPAVFAAFYKVGYKYLLSVEPHSEIWRGELGERGIDFTIEYIKKFIM